MRHLTARQGLAIRAALVVGAFTLLISAAAVTAQETGASARQQRRSACPATLCSTIAPGGGRIARRLKAKADSVSAPCRQAVAEARDGR